MPPQKAEVEDRLSYKLYHSKSAMRSFFRGVAANRFPRLEDENDLWRLLVTITARKAAAQTKRFCRQKRGGGKVRGESAWRKLGESDWDGIDQVMGS